jgi:hypothetical protein
MKERYCLQKNERNNKLDLAAGYVGTKIFSRIVELRESAFNIRFLRQTTHSPYWIQP